MRLFLLAIFLLLAACAGLPQAVRDVSYEDVSYNLVNQDINQYKGVTVRWGGVIIDVENEADFTLLQVLSYPLNFYGYPRDNNSPEGRFVIKTNTFLDPVIYAKDKKITVAGVIQGKIDRLVGNKTIQVPLIESTALHLWPTRECYYNCGYGGFGGYYPPYYFGYPLYPGGYYSPFFY